MQRLPIIAKGPGDDRDAIVALAIGIAFALGALLMQLW